MNTAENIGVTEFTGLTPQMKQKIEAISKPSGLKPVNPLNYSSTLLNCIEQIKISDTSIYIKLNKNLILHAENTVSISDNLNIQIAGQIHLNPVTKLFKAIQSKFKKLPNELPDLG